MCNENVDDLDLVRGIANSDEKALRSFFDSNADLLFAYITHLLNDTPHVVVEDIWQETLLSAIKNIRMYRGNSRLFTWMCGIAKHKVFDYYRKKKISVNIKNDKYENNIEILIDRSILPEKYVRRQQTRLHVTEALGIISPRYKNILIQRYIDGLSVEEIAKSIGKTYKAAESLLSRARQAFKFAFLQLSKDESNE